jgi:hypothetical protein
MYILGAPHLQVRVEVRSQQATLIDIWRGGYGVVSTFMFPLTNDHYFCFSG